MLNKLMHNSFIHITKRTDTPKWQSWLVRVAAVVVALLASAVVSSILQPGTFGAFIQNVFVGNFATTNRIIRLLQNTSLLLLISLAVTPAFKMKFWNIGAEGQVLMGGLMSVVMIKYLGGKVDNSLLIILMLIMAILGGAVWAVIPALFKAKWNTNETLFTLMMNYIAIGLISICIAVWVTSGSQVLGVLKYGRFPKIGGYNYILNIIIVAIITIVVSIYLKFSKHGYELSVVGESQNTAKYIGISVPKVIIRTMLLSGALSGIAGWLLVAGTSHTISTTSAGGMGFTAILVAWLAGLNPVAMVFTSLLVQFFNIGAEYAGSNFGFGTAFPEIITSVFFFVVIASEFFVNYNIKLNPAFAEKLKKKKTCEESVNSVENATNASLEQENNQNLQIESESIEKDDNDTKNIDDSVANKNGEVND